MNENIKYLFLPRSTAVIGASSDPNKIGYKILSNIKDGNYEGNVYPVNPKGGEILGYSVFKDINEIKEEVDLATICVPAEIVLPVVKSCAQKKVKFLSIITSGFGEIGKVKEEEELVKIARGSGMRILGPNIFGVYSAKGKLNATFGPKNIKEGNVAFITQSGALGIALMGKTQTEGIGLSAMVSEGNKADLGESDLLEYFLYDEKTKVIFLYLESLKNGELFLRIAQKLTKQKPIIVLKAGVSKRGTLAAASHTGSLAGDDKIFDAAMKQAGIIRANNVNQAITWIKFLSEAPLPKGKNTLIITNGGGAGVLTTDYCEKYNLKLRDDFDNLKKIYGDVVPYFGSTKNPIDLTGQATYIEYGKALKRAIEDKDTHSIICLGCETAVFDTKNLRTTILENYNVVRDKKPIVFSFVGGKKTEEDLLSLRFLNIPIFGESEEAVSCLGILYKHYYNIQKKTSLSQKLNLDLEGVKKIITEVKNQKRNFLLPYESEEIMKIIGVSLPQKALAKNKKEAVLLAKKIGFPVVLKVVSPQIIHKTEAGGVILDIKNEKETEASFEKIITNCQKYNSKAKIEGVEVNEMIKDGLEVIVGAKKDKNFGKILMFGLGGIYVEVFKDVSFRICPISEEEAFEMVKEIKAYPLFVGVRGEKPKDVDSLKETILKIQALIDSIPEISEIEINPLVVFDKGTKALDIRILLADYSKQS